MTANPDSIAATDAVADMADKLRRGLRLFTGAGDQPRARRATDVILLVVSFVGIVLVGLVAIPEPGISRAVTAFFAALPTALIGMWQLFADLPTLWALVVLVAALTRGKVKVGRDMLLAIVVSAAMWLLLARVVNGAWPEFNTLFGDVQPPPVFPSARLGIPTALIITASPHLVRPARRFGYVVIVLGSIGAVALGASSTLGVVAALLSAAGAAAIVHLIVGSSAGRPSLDDVRFALADMKIAVTDLGAADRQDAGHFAVAAQGADGSELIVKLYGRDALRRRTRLDGVAHRLAPSTRIAGRFRPTAPGGTRSVADAPGGAGRHRHRFRRDRRRHPHRRRRARVASHRHAARRTGPIQSRRRAGRSGLRRRRCTSTTPRTLAARRHPARQRHRSRQARRGPSRHR